MVYKDKARDMKRAPLPSRADKKARELKRLARKTSRRHGKRISDVAKRNGWDEAFDRYDPNWDNQHGPGWDRATRDIVRERRYADNLGALMRWAQSIADANPDTPADELRLKVREIIGWDYMADHLMSHVEDIEAFRINPTQYGWRNRSYGSMVNRNILRDQMVEICQDLWLRGKNKELKKIGGKMVSRYERPNWTKREWQEPIYKWDRNYRKSIPTGEYRTRAHWYRIILSYAEIEEVVYEWIGANQSAVRDFVKEYNK